MAEANGAAPPNGPGQMRDGEIISPPYRVMVSTKFVVLSLLSSMLLAFAVGRAARLVLVEGPKNALLLARRESMLWEVHDGLPSLLARNGNKIPRTRYLSKNFDTSRSSSSSSWLAKSRESVSSAEDETCHPNECENVEQPLPVAAHLMVDIKRVDGEFLNSESRLANAMLEVVNEAELTLLSYHCHGLVPMGVSCVGVLLKNYMSFHTWPEQGVITLDLCVGGTTELLRVLSIIERVFGVPQTGRTLVEKPEMRWAHKVRGFAEDGELLSSTDLGLYVVNNLNHDVKEEVVSVQTQFQRIDIYDLLKNKKQTLESYNEWLLSPHGSHEARDQPLFRPDRKILLDGCIQSTLYNEASYHEALVHPAMFSHANPKRVAIIGGGEGATLREVLKHNTVKEAVMIDIDEMMVNVSRDYIPEWSDCSDLVGSAPWCADDARTRVYYEDALAWFVDRYFDGDRSEEPMDVIVMDALDPESEIPFAKALYSNATFMQSFYDSLSDDGILVMQLGESADLDDPEETYSKYKNRVAAVNLLERVGFESIHAYEESHCGFLGPWTFIVAFKSYSTRKRWYANVAEIEVAIRKRSVRTQSGTNPFRVFDGPTMVSYQVPPRAVETVFCRREPTPKECLEDESTYDSNYPNVPLSSFEVKKSDVGEYAGRGVFAKVNIPQDTYLSAETSCHCVWFMPSTFALIFALKEEPIIGDELEVLYYYMHGYGCISRLFGDRESIVDSGVLTFANHGCKGTYNIGEVTDFDEFTANTNVIPDELSGKSHKGTTIFNPFVDRHLTHMGFTTNRDIKAGEEILANYLGFFSSEEDWAYGVIDLRNQCSGLASGEVTAYEQAHQK